MKNKYNAYIYLSYGKDNITVKYTYYYKNNSFNDINDLIKNVNDINLNPNCSKFIISTESCLNIKHFSANQIKKLAKLKDPFIVNTNGLKNKIKYIFWAIITCSKCKKNLAWYKCPDIYCFSCCPNNIKNKSLISFPLIK
jgi:hypothetical protein